MSDYNGVFFANLTDVRFKRTEAFLSNVLKSNMTATVLYVKVEGPRMHYYA